MFLANHDPRPAVLNATRSRFRQALLLTGLCVMLVSPVIAQVPLVPKSVTPPAPVVLVPLVEGKTIDGKPFKLSALKGKVVLVMFWSTGCAVCRDKMPELRNNYTRVQDFLEYERIISRTVPLKQRFVQLWTGESGYRDNIGKPAQLPAAFLVDKDGKVVERYVGRIPAEAWDRIADLL